MDKRLSIYVSSPDSYSDVLAVFLKGYRRYWSDCPYEFILTTNTKSYEGITCLCNNKQTDTWVERTITALPVIKSKYVMLMCDDIILSNNVDNSLIEMCIRDSYNPFLLHKQICSDTSSSIVFCFFYNCLFFCSFIWMYVWGEIDALAKDKKNFQNSVNRKIGFFISLT